MLQLLTIIIAFSTGTSWGTGVYNPQRCIETARVDRAHGRSAYGRSSCEALVSALD
jgi:hypothetical protein